MEKLPVPVSINYLCLRIFAAILLMLTPIFAFAEDNVCTFNSSDWCVFVTKKSESRCYIASQALEMKAYRNGELLANVNRERGILLIRVRDELKMTIAAK